MSAPAVTEPIAIGPEATNPVASGHVAAAPTATGSIEGQVALQLRPRRRAAPRYPGSATGANEVQRIAAVAYIEGSVEGAAARPPAPSMAQQDTAFVPAALVVPVGTTVAFPNRDPFFHNVFSYSSAQRFDLGRYPRGESKRVVFDSPGVVNVYCEVHDFMRAAVIVTRSGLHALVAEDGRFSIGGVPAGRHKLVVWHADLGTVERMVDVPEGGTARVSLELG